MSAIEKYDALCAVVAEVTALDVAKDLDDKAEGLRVYARCQGNRALELRCAEFRFRMRRRMGELILEAKEAGYLRRGRPKVNVGGFDNLAGVTLDELGIPRDASARAQSWARIPAADFERLLATWRAAGEEGGEQLSLNALLREEQRREEAANGAPQRTDTTADLEALAARVMAGEIPPFGCIVADPPWSYEVYSGKGKDRAADRHYDTMSHEALCALGPTLQALAAPDCALFLWVVDPSLPQALALLEAWGFAYKTRAFCWVKTVAEAGHDASQRFFVGLGYWTRSNPEDCWLATRGKAARRPEATDLRELIIAPRGRHSEKPVEAALRIERLVEGPYLELFGRKKREGWTVWGNQMAAASETTEAAE